MSSQNHNLEPPHENRTFATITEQNDDVDDNVTNRSFHSTVHTFHTRMLVTIAEVEQGKTIHL